MKHILIKSRLLPMALALGLCILPTIAQADGILGGSVVVKEAGQVTVTFQGSSAGYISTLQFGGQDLFVSTVGSGHEVTLDGTFEAGQVLTFSILVENGNTFSTGTGSLNVDGMAHATVSNLDDGGTLVGFEDLLGGGDKDYNDLMFSFSNTNTEAKLVQNPEPATIVLFGSGLLGLGAWRLRKKHA